jgi:hypothetical protein
MLAPSIARLGGKLIEADHNARMAPSESRRLGEPVVVPGDSSLGH